MRNSDMVRGDRWVGVRDMELDYIPNSTLAVFQWNWDLS